MIFRGVSPKPNIGAVSCGEIVRNYLVSLVSIVCVSICTLTERALAQIVPVISKTVLQQKSPSHRHRLPDIIFDAFESSQCKNAWWRSTLQSTRVGFLGSLGAECAIVAVPNKGGSNIFYFSNLLGQIKEKFRLSSVTGRLQFTVNEPSRAEFYVTSRDYFGGRWVVLKKRVQISYSEHSFYLVSNSGDIVDGDLDQAELSLQNFAVSIIPASNAPVGRFSLEFVLDMAIKKRGLAHFVSDQYFMAQAAPAMYEGFQGCVRGLSQEFSGAAYQ